MADADPVAVPVASDRHHGHHMVRKFKTLRNRERAPVKRMHSIGINKSRQVGGTTDTRNCHNLMRLEIEHRISFLQGRKQTKVTAAGTPIRMYLAIKIL